LRREISRISRDNGTYRVNRIKRIYRINTELRSNWVLREGIKPSPSTRAPRERFTSNDSRR